jgi:nucleotide-binding universal stress UspA family protein
MRLAFKTILVATDYGPAAELALEYARSLASRFDAQVHLIHVVEEPFPIGSDISVPEVPNFRDSLIKDAEARMSTYLGQVHGSVSVSGEVLIGAPVHRIVEAAHDKAADLIVMGTHGRGAVGHLLMGNVAERVVRSAPCPVMTVRAAEPLGSTDVAATTAASR